MNSEDAAEKTNRLSNRGVAETIERPTRRRSKATRTSTKHNPDASFTWNSSSEEEDESDYLDSTYMRDGLQALDLSSPASSPPQLPSPHLDSETFYDAQVGSSSFYPMLHQEDDMFADAEASWLHLSPRPQHTTASSATLRQDAVNRDYDLQHQGSSSTLPGATDSANSRIFKKRPMLPPVGPSPNMPLPLPPTPPPKDEPPAKLSQETFREDQRAGATGLGPSGTIRGRPRGATVGAVPGGKVEVKQRVRPRSMLCNEVSSDGDTLHLLLPEPSSSTSSVSRSLSPGESSSRGGKGTSSAGDYMIASSLLADGASTSRSSLGMTRTPSSSANSSSAGLVSSSAQSSEGGGSRSRSGSNASLLQQIQHRRKSHASFVIAVVGHRGSGKSTVIKKGLRQFGLSKPTVLSDKITAHSTICIVDHEQRTIEVLEMDASVLLSPSKRFAWPKFLPPVDAVILCYDASQLSSFQGMSDLLENFAINSLSTVMLACKSETNPKAVDPYYASDMAAVYNVGLAECSVQSEEGKKRMRDCFSFLVKEVAKSRAAAMARGEVLSTSFISTTNSESASEESHQHEELASTSQNGATESTSDLPWSGSPDPNASAAAIAATSAAGVEGEGEGGIALQDSLQKAQLGLQSAKTLGGYVSIDELWDKLFYAAVSGNDERYLLMFMVFYRGFAQPCDLLRQLVARFDALSRGEQSDGVLIRYSLMRLTTMLGDWMLEYPGDLSGPETYPMLCEFFQRLMTHPSTMHVASPLLPLLETVRDAIDDDAEWSKNQDSDKPRSVAADVPPVKPVTSSPEEGNRSRSESVASTYQDGFVSMPRMLLPVEGRHRSGSDVTASSDGQASSSSLTISTPTLSNSASGSTIPSITASSTAAATGMDQKTILRGISNTLFDVKDEAIAQELTRIEWDLFTNVGSRDLLRHILVSKTYRSPESPVAKSIAHFNYISYWVCSMILVQNKTKQRARLLEKFMEIAGILRRINNYNTLHAVLAGLGNASIHRLKNTRELLVGKPVIKTYQSLARLMGSDRSFAAYRLALENSEGRTIPYLGIHLQDILSMSDGNPSKRTSDGLVHWKKFSLMDEAVMGILRCQQYQEPLQENPSISKLIFDLPVMDEDELYQRSLHVEPRQAVGATGLAGSRIINKLFHGDT